MFIKGEVGGKIHVEGEIVSITVNKKNGIQYGVKFNFENAVNVLKESDLIFPEEKTCETVKEFETPSDVPRRGRPRKATVDDMIEKARKEVER